MQLPQEIKVETKTERRSNPVITLTSIDKQLIGHVAAKIRSLRPPEPYKGKGIKFVGEQLRRKAGKSARCLIMIKSIRSHGLNKDGKEEQGSN
ncbi:MAG: 50S ribosomal protein L6 [Marinilabiliales bacterium]|nr:50S ribosomal protein L6 [Marinilabiliales bacterium]